MSGMPLKAKDILGEYQLDARVGLGASGEVWRAQHHIWPDRVVAIKVFTNPDFVRGITHEGIINDDLSRLDSPHVVKMLGLNVLSHPPYMVMEYVAGNNLRQRLEKASSSRLPLSETIRVLQGVLKGLNVAHGMGIVHRDIKPENVLLDENGLAKISDFSIALKTPTTESLRLSIETNPEGAPSLAGTLVYMSPEQRQGGTIDQRSDVFSIGLLLFEMLTGDLPQPGDRLGDFIPKVPEGIESVFQRCFTRRDRRFPDAGAILKALQEFRKPTAKRRSPTTIINGKMIANSLKEEARKPSAATKQSPANGPSRKSKLSKPKLSTRALTPEKESPAKAHPSTRDRLSTRSLVEPPASSTKAGSPPPSRSRRKNTMAGEPARVEDLARLLADLPDDPSGISDPRPSRQHRAYLPSLQALYQRATTATGMAHFTSGNYEKAAREFRELVKRTSNDPAALKGLAVSLTRSGKYKEALDAYRRLLERKPEAADVWNNVGVISMSLGRLKDAERALLRAVELRPRYASAHANLGAVYLRTGRAEDARRESRIALDIDPDNFEASYNLQIQ